MVLYFSGTGNSKYIAKRIAEAIRENTVDLNMKIKENDTSPLQTGRDVIIVTPTYAWRIPKIVSEWIDKTEFIDGKRIWFVMNCGSEIGNAAKYNRELSEQKKLQYMGTARILMPENYIAMFDAPKAEEARKIVAKAEPDIEKVIACSMMKRQVSVRLRIYRKKSGMMNTGDLKYLVCSIPFPLV